MALIIAIVRTSGANALLESRVPMARGELYQRPGRTVAAFPTDDDLRIVFVDAPIAESRPSAPRSNGTTSTRFRVP